MQADSIKPTLKAPDNERLKLCYDEPPSNFAFNLNLHFYTKVAMHGVLLDESHEEHHVGRCKPTASKPVLKAPMVSELEARISGTACNFSLSNLTCAATAGDSLLSSRKARRSGRPSYW